MSSHQTARPTALASATEPAMRSHAWTTWGGYRMPARFADADQETLTLRRNAGIADLSPVHKYHIGGVEGAAFLDRLATVHVEGMAHWAISPAPFCDGKGRLVALTQITRIGDNDFMVSSDTDIAVWFEEARRAFDVTVTDLSDHFAAIGVYGPRAREVLGACDIKPGLTLEPATAAYVKHAGALLLVKQFGAWCSAYGLSNGFEIWAPADAAPKLWDELLAASPETALPVGRETLERERIFMGRPRAGADFRGSLDAITLDHVPTPIDLGWEDWIDFGHPGFCGHTALRSQRDARTGARLVRLDVTGPVERAAKVTQDGRIVGTVTSSVVCPLIGETRAIVLCDGPVSQTGDWQVSSNDPAHSAPIAARLAEEWAGPEEAEPQVHEHRQDPVPVIRFKNAKAKLTDHAVARRPVPFVMAS